MRRAEVGTKPSQLGLVYWCPEIWKIKNFNLTYQVLRHEWPWAVLNTPKWFQKWKIHSLSERNPGGTELGLEGCFEQRFSYLQALPRASFPKVVKGSDIGLLTSSCVVLCLVVQSLSSIQLFATLWTIARQVPLSSTISRSLLRFMFIESMMLSKHFILCCPLLLLPSSVPFLFKGGRVLYQNYLNSWFCF